LESDSAGAEPEPTFRPLTGTLKILNLKSPQNKSFSES
jgi:hypothetical protein